MRAAKEEEGTTTTTAIDNDINNGVMANVSRMPRMLKMRFAALFYVLAHISRNVIEGLFS